jgi:hypothetical protein
MPPIAFAVPVSLPAWDGHDERLKILSLITLIGRLG